MKLPISELQRVHQMLNAIPFLAGLDQSDVETLAYNLNLRHFATDETIIREGEPGRLFYLISKGRVGVFKKRIFRQIRIASLGAGDFFGEMALLEHTARVANVMGEEEGEIYTLTREGFEGVLMAKPVIAERIRETAHERSVQNLLTRK